MQELDEAENTIQEYQDLACQGVDDIVQALDYLKQIEQVLKAIDPRARSKQNAIFHGKT